MKSIKHREAYSIHLNDSIYLKLPRSGSIFFEKKLMSRNIEEKLSIERHRQAGCILLFLEGGFYRAYEHSALDAIKNLHDFKVTCRFYKAVGERVACVGFPVSSLAKFVITGTDYQNQKLGSTYFFPRN